MNDFTLGAVFPRAKLALYSDVGAPEWSQALHERSIWVVLCILESWYKSVASLAHANNLRAVQSEIELVFVGLRQSYIDTSSAGLSNT